MGRIWIYARTSTSGQDTANQIHQLQLLYPGSQFVEETASGAKARPVLERLVRELVRGDTLVVSALDRLGRRASEILLLLEALDKRGVVLKSVRESIDFSTIGGRLIFQVMAALAESERRIIGERTKTALAARRAAGVRLGRPPKFSPELIERARQLRLEGTTLKAIAEETGISWSRVQWMMRDTKRPLGGALS